MICLPVGFFDSNSKWLVPLLFFILPIPFFALNVDLLSTYLAPGDGLYQGIPAFLYHQEWSLWLPHVAGGIPFSADPQNQAFYLPAIILSNLLPNAFGYNLLLLLHYSLMGLGVYLFLRNFPLKKLAAFAAGVMMMFSGFMAAHKGHFAMVEAAAWLPWFLLSLRLAVLSWQWVWGALAGLAWGMMFLAGYPAIAMYAAMIAIPYAVFLALASNKHKYAWLKAVSICIGCFGWGLLFASAQIFPLLEAMPLLLRQGIDYSFFTSYSFEWSTWILWFFPYFFGSQADYFYAFPYKGPWNLTELTGYMGVLPTLLAVFAFYAVRKTIKEVWFWFVVAFVGLVLVMGDNTPLYQLMYHAPIYNMFRVPARNWFEVDFAIAILAAIGINVLLSSVWLGFSRILKKLLLMAIVYLFVAVVSLFVWHLLQPVAFGDISSLWMRGDKESPAYWLPLSMMVLLIFMLGAILYKRLHPQKAVIIFIIFIFMDLFSFGFFHDYRYTDNQALKADSKIIEAMDSDKMSYRILPVHEFGKGLYPNLNMLHGYIAANGYGPLWLSDYLKATGLSTNGLPIPNSDLLTNDCLLSALAVKYIHTDHVMRQLSKQWKLKVVTSEGIYIYENHGVLPRVRLANQLNLVGDQVDILGKWKNCNVTNSATSVLSEGEHKILEFPSANIIDVDWSNEEVKVQLESSGDILLILADTSYPGWVATIDHKKADLITVDGLFRGVRVNHAGQHTIEFNYFPLVSYWGVFVSILVALLSWLLLYFYRKASKPKAYCVDVATLNSEMTNAVVVSNPNQLNSEQLFLWKTVGKPE